ncbi:MAG: beta-N-acetylhexosaminidase [Armatimonadetes bacterium]|nr:beta-N-acetylhexosaminidase [Armatimonadota bacterium]
MPVAAQEVGLVEVQARMSESGTGAAHDANDLSLDDAIGQLMCFGWQGDGCDAVNDHARELVSEMRVGSVVLLARNVSSPERTRSMLSELQKLSRVPLLVAVDQEGGLVNRFGPPLHAFPGNMALGACADRGAELARRQAAAQARELRAVGVTWNLAPVLDVNNNPANPIIGVRSFGEDPIRVGELGAAAIRGYGDGGVLACAKHFPGHGDTSVDSHLGLPTVTASRDRLDAVEFVPFRAAIAAGVRAIMTTHIVFPVLDPDSPATVSHPILTGLLRDTMGFNGLIATDCLEMAAIGEGMGTPAGAVAAIQAGADVVLVCHTLEVQRETVRAVRQAVDAGILDESRVREAASRVLSAKAGLRLLSQPTGAARSHDATSADLWTDPAHAELEREIARESITVVENSGGIPIPTGARVCVASWGANCQALADGLRALGVTSGSVTLDTGASASSLAEATARLVEADRAVLLTALPASAHHDGDPQAAFVRHMHECLGARLTVVAVRNPYDIAAYPEVANYVCTYGTRECSISALAEALAGVVTAAGRLPVTLPLPAGNAKVASHVVT